MTKIKKPKYKVGDYIVHKDELNGPIWKDGNYMYIAGKIQAIVDGDYHIKSRVGIVTQEVNIAKFDKDRFFVLDLKSMFNEDLKKVLK